MRGRVSTASTLQRLGVRAVGRLGGLRALADPERRRSVEGLLRRGAQAGYSAQVAAGRAFVKRRGNGDPARLSAAPRGGVFDLTPTEDQAMLRDAAAAFADGVLREAGREADDSRGIPAAVAEAAAELGLTLIGVPAALDGIAEEASAVTGALVLEELARGDLSLAVAIMGTASVATAIALYGSADQQATYLPHFTGEAPVRAAALALQEPQPLFDPLAPRTVAVRDGEHLVLDGTKALVARAVDAELFVVSALLDGEARLVIVEASSTGLMVEDDPAMGLRAAHTGRLRLESVRVPAGNLLGSAADHVDAIRRSRLAWAALAVGTSQAVLDQVRGYVVERTAFGEPIGHRQAVAFTVADIAIELDGLRLATWRAAARLDAGKDAAEEVAVARELTRTYAVQIGSHAVQLLGGHGFVKEFDNERWYRDLRATGALEGMVLI